MQRVLTVCPHCSAGCGLYLLVDHGEVVGVMPSAGHPVSRGSLCMKGWTSFQHLRRPERLESPHIRLNGTLVPISWEEAFNFLVDRLKAVRATHGGHTIGLWASARTTNEELFLLERIASQALETKAIRLDSELHSLAHVPPPFVDGPASARFDDIQAADLLVIFGHHLEEHHPRAASRILKAMEGGARVVVVSPCKDLFASKGTLWLQPHSLEDAVSSLTAGEQKPDDQLAAMWTEAECPLLVYPLKSLPLAREVHLLRRFEAVLARRNAKVLLLFPRTNSRGAFHQEIGRSTAEPLDWRALVILEQDPAITDKEFEDLALGLDFLMVQDLFVTETAKLAHLVLPTASFAEKGGTVINTEGRRQEFFPAIPPPGGARPAWAILAELARRLGLSDVGSTLEEIRQRMASVRVEACPPSRMPEPVLTSAGSHSGIQHIPDRLGVMWLKDTILCHTDDWQREHQDRWIEMHSEDAKQLGLRPGWMVRVTGDGGEFRGIARISERVGHGILVTPYHLFEGPVQVERAA